MPNLQSPETLANLDNAAPPDPNENSPEREHCGTCRFFSPSDGRCLRFPPYDSSWAMVGEDDWCGEYQAGEPYQPHDDTAEGEIPSASEDAEGLTL